jgi:hypothetical protein
MSLMKANQVNLFINKTLKNIMKDRTVDQRGVNVSRKFD